ncbi:hypothetical protein [Candidatus Glomeribacter gigasporarum]|uniref:hypothetical protein n=1 Tax=Candidatus Glomeribacter gigasporarum TaxID=132144 RepID=UPI001EEFDDE1|nr:hypothetical protein [Candidatus Glomeribacter gigasporarum]
MLYFKVCLYFIDLSNFSVFIFYKETEKLARKFDMLKTYLPTVDESVSIKALLGVAEQATDILDQIRDAMLEPYPRKKAPTFKTTQIAALCNLDKARFHHLTKKGDLPAGESHGHGQSKVFSLEDVIMGSYCKWICCSPRRKTGANYYGRKFQRRSR